MMGQSCMQAKQTSQALVAYAKDLGVSPKMMAEGYAKLSTQLAKLGKDGVRAFKDLARVQKITGMEMEKVLKLINEFDTFDDAATMAGKLNAALGGNFVNAMDMMITHIIH